MSALSGKFRRLAHSLPQRRQLAGLRMQNLVSRRPVLSGDGPVVSLTSYGKRMSSVFLSLESIARGNLLPSRLILWLDDPNVAADPPRSLRRLQRRGLEIRKAEDLGPHKKYYPYVDSIALFDSPLVTADDDVIYPPTWLEDLDRAHRSRNDLVHCHRAHVMVLDGGGIAPYANWRRCNSTAESFRNFATGVSGIIYPPAFLAYLKQQGKAFLSCCPRADDIWLHVCALRAGFRVRQVTDVWTEYPEIPDTQDVALCRSNLFGTGNDDQIRRTYRQRDIDRLAEVA